MQFHNSQQPFEDSDYQILFPMIKTYLQHLQMNHRVLVTERKSAIKLSKTLRNEFREKIKGPPVISHDIFHRICKQYTNELENIQLPHLPSASQDTVVVDQMMKFLMMQTITVNGEPLPQAHSNADLIGSISDALSPGKGRSASKEDSCFGQLVIRILMAMGRNSTGQEAFQIV